MSANTLTIKITDDAKEKGWVFSNPGKITTIHGEVSSADQHKVVLKSTGAYGPDAVIQMNCEKSDAGSIMELQQNYCFMKAGQIHVTHKDGKFPNYKIKMGSYADGRGGEVTIFDFED